MFQFLFGVAFGAAGYWAWQSFGRDLVGMGGDQDTSYGGFNTDSSSPSTSSFGSSGGASSSGASPTGGSASGTPPIGGSSAATGSAT